MTQTPDEQPEIHEPEAGASAVPEARPAVEEASPDAPAAGTTAGGTTSAAEAPAQAPSPSARRGMRGSARSMVISMGVVLALCFAFVALVPRMKEGAAYERPPVDVTLAADRDASDAKWDVSVPVGLGPDWEARNSKYGISTGDIQTWHMGFKAPTGQYVALEEAQEVSKDWLEGSAGTPTGDGDIVINGQRWTRYADDTKNHFALVRVKDDLTTIVSGPASYEVLAEFAASLRPRAKQTAATTP